MIEEISARTEEMHRSTYDGVLIPDERILRIADHEEGYPGEAGAAGDIGWKSDDAFKCLMDNTPEAFWQMDNNLTITFTNAACEKLYGGLDKKDLIGRSVLEFLTPEGIDHLKKINVLRMKEEGQGIKTDLAFYELQMRRKDGSYFWAGISSTPLRDVQGQVIGYHGITRDISAFKQLETDRSRREDVLKQTEKMNAAANLTGRIIHELNNIMTGILGYSQLLLMQPASDRNDFHRHVENILRTGERATAIIQDLLAISRKDVLSLTFINLNELIPGCLKMSALKKLSERYPGITLHLDLEPSLAAVNGSRQQLDKAIGNLLYIAHEKAGAGGTVAIATRTIYLGRPISGCEDLREGEYVALSVTDTGAGFADEDANRIFEPFYIKKYMNKGITGLELTVVREVVRDHDGFVDIAGRPGCGATFTVYLPVSHAGGMPGNHGMAS